MNHLKPGYLKAVLLLVPALILFGCLNDRFKEISASPAPYTALIVQNLNKGVELKNVYMTPSKRYPGDFYVAGEIFGKHMAGVVTGVWILNGSTPPSQPFSVSQAAIAFSRCSPINTAPDMTAARLSSNTEARRLMTFIEGKHYR